MYNIYYILFHCRLRLKLGFAGCREQIEVPGIVGLCFHTFSNSGICCVPAIYETCFLTSWVSNCLTSHREDLKSSNLTLNRITRWGMQTSVGD